MTPIEELIEKTKKTIQESNRRRTNNNRIMKKVEEIKRPLKKGEVYLVPCLVRYEIESEESEIWRDLSEPKRKIFICPVINHPHNDVENGQKETHYHLDYRFIKYTNNSDFPIVVNKHSRHIFGEVDRPTQEYGELKYIALPVINENFAGITPVELISKSKLKHKCIHKGKCPHRGFDMAQVKVDKNGIKTCPLHGLKFNNQNMLITE